MKAGPSDQPHRQTSATPARSMRGQSAGKKVAAFFDLDKTIIAKSSAFAYGRQFLDNGLISPGVAAHLAVAQAAYRLVGHSNDQMDSTRDNLASMVRGWDVQQVSDIVETTLHEVVSPAIYMEARELIALHEAAGHDVIIVSASAAQLVAPIARELGIRDAVTTTLGVQDGRFTGEVLFYCKGERKAQAIRDLAANRGYNLEASFAYSDSATDIPMLEVVGNAVAVNPDRALKRYAKKHGWTIRSFKNPVPLFTVPSRRRVGAWAAGLVAVAVVGGWLLGASGPGRMTAPARTAELCRRLPRRLRSTIEGLIPPM